MGAWIAFLTLVRNRWFKDSIASTLEFFVGGAVVAAWMLQSGAARIPSILLPGMRTVGIAVLGSGGFKHRNVYIRTILIYILCLLHSLSFGE
jgi:hypothetical protein